MRLLAQNKWFLTTYQFRYLPATLIAKEGKIINTVTNKSLINVWNKTESGVFGPEEVIITNIPIIPKKMEDQINIFVAIFCI